mgnify:CR=1 FL=1
MARIEIQFAQLNKKDKEKVEEYLLRHGDSIVDNLGGTKLAFQDHIPSFRAKSDSNQIG